MEEEYPTPEEIEETIRASGYTFWWDGASYIPIGTHSDEYEEGEIE